MLRHLGTVVALADGEEAVLYYALGDRIDLSSSTCDAGLGGAGLRRAGITPGCGRSISTGFA